MKIVCNECMKTFNYPLEQINHRHENLELDLVPPNFWSIEDYLPEFEITISDEGKIIAPKVNKSTIFQPGNTPFICISENVYIKDESENPTGSFKDRGMETMMNEILLHKKDKVAVVSCGSGAISTIKYAKEFGIHSIVFVHKEIEDINLKLISNADEVHSSDNFIKSYEEFMEFCIENKDTVYWGFLNANISYMLGLRTLAYEIIRDLKDVPDIVVIPCGSGMNIVAQNLAFREMYHKGIISKIPKIAIVEIEGGNPIKQGFEAGNSSMLHVIENPVNSKTILSNDTCFNYRKICDIVKRKEGFFVSVNDYEIDEFIRANPEYEKKYDYTSLAVMPALQKCIASHKGKKIVTVITCKNRAGGSSYE